MVERTPANDPHSPAADLFYRKRENRQRNVRVDGLGKDRQRPTDYRRRKPALSASSEFAIIDRATTMNEAGRKETIDAIQMELFALRAKCVDLKSKLTDLLIQERRDQRTKDVIVNGKVCRKCFEKRKARWFYRDNNRGDGHSSYCRLCQSKVARERQKIAA